MAENPTTLLFDTRNDSYRILRSKITDRVQETVARYDTNHAQKKESLMFDERFEILVKPGVHTKQVDYLVVNNSNLTETASIAWTNSQMKANPGSFHLESFVYLKKSSTNPQTIRRATEDRINEMTQRILSVEWTETPGPATTRYMATQMARQIGTPDFVNLPNNPTIAQLSHIDQQAASIRSDLQNRNARESDEYRPVRFRINGDVVTMQVNLTDMRLALQLPPYSLIAPYRSPIQQSKPTTNMEDIDHKPSDIEIEEHML
ncbi:hypothetical protein AC1031_002255 [Aphanomyces cochlioides]|nr:hypothetical protein AC1031_002255 [Aphanomyces cochlioides]